MSHRYTVRQARGTPQDLQKELDRVPGDQQVMQVLRTCVPPTTGGTGGPSYYNEAWIIITESLRPL